MREFVAIIAWFASGLLITAALAFALEHRQLANRIVDETVDVRPGIVAVTPSGFAIGIISTKTLQFEFHAGSLPNAI